MPFSVRKVGTKWKVYNLDKRAFTKASFKTKETAQSQARNWIRYSMSRRQ